MKFALDMALTPINNSSKTDPTKQSNTTKQLQEKQKEK